MKTVVMLLIFTNLSGCVGVMTYGREARSECSLNTCPLIAPKKKDSSPQSRMVNLTKYVTTKGEVEQLFGRPKEVIASPAGWSERWSYSEGFSWSGITVWAGIGIPLRAPVKRLHRTFIFENGVLIGVEIEKTVRTSCHLIESRSMCW